MILDFQAAFDGETVTKLMEQAISALRHVPADQQDEVARVVMQFAGIRPPYALYVPDPEEAAELAESEAAADRGEFATDDQVRAIWAKYGCEAASNVAGNPPA